ncbi:N-acetyltransferase, putative [Trypanosoma equiperdum]|uniref:N-acetyltransferase, putative n=2 Tax=Trypanozoon TaxID=39700 RepID=Q57XN8_TRYB2|nr:N-acetyltransferase, putative [Trypanosoma brucei brucei TREU927]AAX69634.1 N-acetyltransferase, putative [Trypanosoma brucei]AAZ12300.1 N-acetyltransferase, putative [Trypanosoma brucei brucei TREU927]SCU64776.1 N-acetyltransferase, putative [Trypanosoma equiperdum]
MPKKGKKNATKNNVKDVDIDALVAAIEGTSVPSKNSKEGMTRKQAMALEEKQMEEVLTKPVAAAQPLVDEHRLRMSLLAERLMHEKAIRDAEVAKALVPLKEEEKAWQKVSDNKYIRYEQFDGDEEVMNFIVQLFTKELTEPYSSFTYEYFIFGWPDLTIVAYGYDGEDVPDASVKGKRVGAVVSRVSRKHIDSPLRGYVAMFAVIPEFRGFRLGSRLVTLTIELMREKGCDEVYLETPTNNERALSLYLNLGFAKSKFLPRYYLDHSDAVRLKLWLKDPPFCTPVQPATPAVAVAAAASPSTSTSPI